MKTWTYEDVKEQFGLGFAAVLFWDEFAPRLGDNWSIEELLEMYCLTLPGTPAWVALRKALETRATHWNECEEVVDALSQGDELRERLIGRMVERADSFMHWFCIVRSQPHDEAVVGHANIMLFERRQEANAAQWMSVLCLMPDQSILQSIMLREASHDADWLDVFRRTHRERPYLARRAWMKLCGRAKTCDAPEQWVRMWLLAEELGDTRRQRRAEEGLRACHADVDAWDEAEMSLRSGDSCAVADVILLKIAEGGGLDFGGDLLEEFENPRRFSRAGVERAARAFVAVDGLDAHELLDVYRALSDGKYDEALLAEILDRAMACEAPADTWIEELESFETRDDDPLLERALVARLVQYELTLEQATYVYECAAKLEMRAAQIALLQKLRQALGQSS